MQGMLDLAGVARTDRYAVRLLTGPVLIVVAIARLVWVDLVERRSARAHPTSQ
ncbi:hypothetical protein [Streptomyces sp. NPDC001970]